MNGLVAALGHGIDALSANVFAKVSLFGVEVEGIVLWLAVPMLFFTAWLGFLNLTKLPLALRIVRGDFRDKSAPGEVSQFQALSTALSGTVGLGNIAGVGVAITTGGPGAAFWMFVIGWFAMSLKCAEVTLGLKYRVTNMDGTVSGGPMYTLEHGLARRGLPRSGKLLGVLYAIFALGGAIPLLQVNQSFAQVSAVTGFDNGLAYGIIMAITVAVVVVGSVRWLGATTSRLVPAMCVVYLGGCLLVLATHAGAIPGALVAIVTEAFNPTAVAGGALGAFVIGMRRAVYSSEAGIGSAVIAHSAAKTAEPASEGLVALLEPFIDTVIVCSITALTIVVAGSYLQPGVTGVGVISAAFAQVSPGFPIVLAVAVYLFAYSTLVSWGYYGTQAWGYLFGRSRVSIGFYKVFYCAILPLGSVLDLGKVVDLVDSLFFLMAVPNILGLYILAGDVRAEMRGYLARISGK